jgi:hypothetical protein
MKRYRITWHCLSCSQEHSFFHRLDEFGDWPNKFADLQCQNPDCRQVQDVRFQTCTLEEA